jgi:hypothetical protein
VIRATTGLVNNPSYSFIGDTDTGIYQPVAGQVSVTCNGATNTVFDPTGLTIEGSKLFRHGAVIQDTGNDAFVHFEMSWPVTFDADVKGGGTANISDGLIKGTTQYATSVTSYSKSHNMTVNEATGVITCDVTGDYEVTYSISGQMLVNNSIHLVEDSTTTPTLVGEGHFVEDHAIFKTISKSGIYTLTATKNYQLAVLSPGTVATTTVLNMLGYSITMKRLRTSDE